MENSRGSGPGLNVIAAITRCRWTSHRMYLVLCCSTTFESSQPGTIRLLPPVMNGIMTDEDLNFIGPIAPVKLFSGREGRCSAKLLFGNLKFIGTMFRIVFQRSPWNGKVFLTEAKETAEAQNCIGNLAGQLVDHQALDHADLFARWSADRRTLDAIACNQIVSHAAPLCMARL